MVAGLEHNIHIPEDSLLRAVKNKNILRTHIAVQPGDKLPKLRIAPCLGIPESLPEICLFCARLHIEQLLGSHRLAVRLSEQIECCKLIFAEIALELKIVYPHILPIKMRSKPLSDILYRLGQPLRVNMPVLVERWRFEGNGAGIYRLYRREEAVKINAPFSRHRYRAQAMKIMLNTGKIADVHVNRLFSEHLIRKQSDITLERSRKISETGIVDKAHVRAQRLAVAPVGDGIAAGARYILDAESYSRLAAAIDHARQIGQIVREAAVADDTAPHMQHHLFRACCARRAQTLVEKLHCLGILALGEILTYKLIRVQSAEIHTAVAEASHYLARLSLPSADDHKFKAVAAYLPTVDRNQLRIKIVRPAYVCSSRAEYLPHFSPLR